MKLGYVIIFVQNVQTTLAFYEQAFGLKQLFLAESLLYGELDTGHTKLAFVDETFVQSNDVDFNVNRIDMQKKPGFEIAFTTPDVASAYHHALQAGCTDAGAPIQKPWGQTVAYVRDINGILVEICSPL
jgi:lactoylglutathione lyase